MTTIKAALYDGQKTVDLWGDKGWTYLTGSPDSEKGVTDYFKKVPWLYRGTTLRADAVASMPFALVDSNDEDYDISSDWENKVGFLPNITRLLWLIEASLTLCGRAYLWREYNRAATKGMRYLNPYSITPVIDKDKGLTGFERYIGGSPMKVTMDDIIYFWLPDPYVEMGEPRVYPATAALAASGALNSMDTFITNYFDHGAIKATLLTVKGVPSEAERQKIESFWKNFISGLKNAFSAKVLNAEAITPVVVGDGVKELENQTLTTEKREDIATALGVPQTILFSNAANYATALQDDRHFYSKTILPECEQIASVLNDQIFSKLGLYFEFRPEELDVFQTDENDRAASLNQLVQAGIPVKLAMEILGYDLSEEQWAELEEEQEQEPEPVIVPTVTPEEQQPVMEDTAAEEMRRWKRKALNALERGKSPAVVFESNFIPLEQGEAIASALANATTPDEVKAAFNGETHVFGKQDGMMALAEELRKARELLEATNEPHPSA